ncbi:MAG: histidine kinase [Saprospiraceae bacterium]|nr:histidine kinase [Saprospiraceae bacterium]
MRSTIGMKNPGFRIIPCRKNAESRTFEAMRIPVKLLLLHLLFWLLYLLSQGLVFMNFYEMENITISPETGREVITRVVSPENFYQALHVELWKLPGKLIAVYLNLYLLMPRLLFQRKWWAYGLAMLLVLALVSVLHYGWLDQYLARPQELLLSRDHFSTWIRLSGLLQYAAGCLPVVVFTGAIQLVRHYFTEKNTSEALRRHQVETELQYLKTQLNPHFLFNTQNNLYGLALDRSDRMPGLLLQLSGIMSYILHEAKAPELPLERELDILNDLIALESLRWGDHLSIRMERQGQPEHWRMPPLLLVPFVENAFKHGGSAQGLLDLEINLNAQPEQLEFWVKNNRDAGRPGAPNSGIGLENVRRRLDLLFPGQYSLQVDNQADFFYIHLKIKRA